MPDYHAVCRSLLKGIMGDVREHVPVEDRKKVWLHKSWKRGDREFHGPNGFYWYGNVCCYWNAKYEGWCAYLRHLGIEDYMWECDKENSNEP